MEIKNLDLLEEIAKRSYDGHVTLLRFTSGWKVVFGTPFMEQENRRILEKKPAKMTLEEAIEHEVFGHRLYAFETRSEVLKTLQQQWEDELNANH